MTTTKHSYARDSSKSSRMLLFAIVLIAAMETAYIGYTSSVRNQNSDFNTRTLSVKKKPVMPIKELSIIGERNSGTSWTVDHLTECFSHSLNVIDQLVRHKHWFQHDVPNGRERVGTAVVAIFRKSLISDCSSHVTINHMVFNVFPPFFERCVSY